MPGVERSTAPSIADGIRETMHRHVASHRQSDTSVYAATRKVHPTPGSVAPVASTLPLPPESPREYLSRKSSGLPMVQTPSANSGYDEH